MSPGASVLYFLALLLALAGPAVALVGRTASAEAEDHSLDPACAVLPRHDSGVCGPKTSDECLGLYGSHIPPLNLNNLTDGVKESTVTLGAIDYLLLKQLELDYTIEFMKHPLPWTNPVDLPYCGIKKLGVPKEKRDPWDVGGAIGGAVGGAVGAIGGAIGGVVGTVTDAFAPNLGPLPTEVWQAIEDEWKRGYSRVFPGRVERPLRPICLPTSIQIPVHFSVFAAEIDTALLITPEKLLGQVKVLNKAVAPLGITFWMASINSHTGERYRKFTQHGYYDDKDPRDVYQQQIMQKYRYGGNDELNVYIVESITDGDCSSGLHINGYCTLGTNLQEADHSVDGCVIAMDTLPPLNDTTPVPKGNTLVHEVGHWFGLRHIFPPGREAGVSTTPYCAGSDDDGIEDTIRFPNDVNMWAAEQRRCCKTGEGEQATWDYCPESTTYHVGNHMSYSDQRGTSKPGDDPGTQPWTDDQRAYIFAWFFTFRRGIPPGTRVSLELACNRFPVFRDLTLYETVGGTTPSLKPRSLLDDIRHHVVRGASVLGSGAALRKTLKRLCASPIDENTAIDPNSGEEVRRKNGVWQPPASGGRCPDRSAPPCFTDALKPEELYDPCPDGSAPPCPELPLCGSGTRLTCAPINKCLDGSTPPCRSTKQPPPGKPNSEQADVSSCPKACDVFRNGCDATTAPTCTFPDPRVPKPRGACACRPGYKASGYADNDSTKQWRLPVLGQEHRVWVAEGVVCDKLCVVSGGVDSCKEVSVISKACIG